MRRAPDNIGIALYCAGRIGNGLKQSPGELDRAERIADVVAHDGEDPLFEIASQCKLVLVVLLQRFLGLASLVDVHAAADKARECPGLVREGHATVENPTVHAVVTAQPVLHLERLAPVEVIEVMAYAALEVARVDAFGPAVPHLLLERAPGVGEPPLVEVVALRVDSGPPDHDRGMLDEKAVFRQSQRLIHIC